MKNVDRVKAHIDFPSSDSIRITTPYRQKTFNLTGRSYFDLEKLVELKIQPSNKLPATDFYLAVAPDGDSPSKKYYYEVYATVANGRKDVVSDFQHHTPTTVEVKIYRQK